MIWEDGGELERKEKEEKQEKREGKKDLLNN